MSSLYPKGADHLQGKATQTNLLTDAIKVMFYAGSYVSTHEFVSDLTGASIVARSGALSGKVLVNGVFDANDITIAAVSGSAFAHVLCFKDAGADASSVLLANFDVPAYTPTGGDVTVVFNAAGLWSIA